MRLKEAQHHLTETNYQRSRELDDCFLTVIAQQADALSLTDRLNLALEKGQNGETSVDIFVAGDLAIPLSSCQHFVEGSLLYTVITSAATEGGWDRNQSVTHFDFNPKFPTLCFNIGLTSILADSPEELRNNPDFARAIGTALKKPYKRSDFQSVGRW